MTLILTKDRVEESMKNLPEKFSLDELIERMMLIEKIKAADEEVERGEFLTEEEVDKEIASWFE